MTGEERWDQERERDLESTEMTEKREKKNGTCREEADKHLS